MSTLNLNKTALIAVDLQAGIAENPQLVPYSGAEVVTQTQKIATALKNTPALIVLVHVATTPAIALRPLTDRPKRQTTPAPNYSELILPSAKDPTVANQIEVLKHNPGAFYGTDLDLQLRRRKIDTLILTGLFTSNGVYMTSKEAYQAGYEQLIVSDAMADPDLELHQVFVHKMLSQLGRVRTTEQILNMLQAEEK